MTLQTLTYLPDNMQEQISEFYRPNISRKKCIIHIFSLLLAFEYEKCLTIKRIR